MCYLRFEKCPLKSVKRGFTQILFCFYNLLEGRKMYNLDFCYKLFHKKCSLFNIIFFEKRFLIILRTIAAFLFSFLACCSFRSLVIKLSAPQGLLPFYEL